MMAIGREYGKFRHEVGQLPITELVKYAADLIHRNNIQKKEAEKIAKESRY